MQSNYERQPLAKSVSILGVNFNVTGVTVNGQIAKFSYDPTTLKLLIDEKIDLRKQFILVWS